MDPLQSKAQRQIASASSKSKSSSRRKKKRSGRGSQNAGQPSGPSRSVASERSRSRAAVHPTDDDDEAPSPGGGSSSRGAACASYTVGALHAIDMGLGLALVVYGAMVHVTSVTAAAVAYGLLLLLGGVAGAIGYYSGACNRRGLRGSAVAGGLAMLVDIGAFIAVLVGWDTFVQFLKDNSEALMLNDASVDTISGLRILFAVIFIVLAGLEGHRCLAMWGMKDTLPDGGSSRTSRSSTSSRSGCCDKVLSLCGLGKRKKTDDFVVFDDNASMESSLLWSKDGAQPTSDDYLEFVPEHERGLANFTASVGLPRPPEDRVDY